MFELIELKNDEKSLKLEYQFITKINNNWKQNYKIGCILKNQKPLLQSNLSDFEYFKLTRQKDTKVQKYMLIKNNKPVCSIDAIYHNADIVNLVFVTLPEYRHLGYATMAVKMLEAKLFTTSIKFLTITDITQKRISTKIAIKLGYIYNEEQGVFIKPNPNIKWEEYLSNKRLS